METVKHSHVTLIVGITLFTTVKRELFTLFFRDMSIWEIDAEALMDESGKALDDFQLVAKDSFRKSI
jgi:hypothetical protein